jgi:large subunit ribosomal protein L32
MPVPKRKRSRARRDSRFANKGMSEGSIVLCAQCQEPLRPHVACTKCGFYKGKKMLATKSERILRRTQDKSRKKQKETVETTERQ